MSNRLRQIHRFENALARGCTVHSTCTGGIWLERRANNTSIRHRHKVMVPLTPGRRRMLELKLRSLVAGADVWLWQSKLADAVMQGSNTPYSYMGKPIIGKPSLTKGQTLQGLTTKPCTGRCKDANSIRQLLR